MGISVFYMDETDEAVGLNGSYLIGMRGFGSTEFDSRSVYLDFDTFFTSW